MLALWRVPTKHCDVIHDLRGSAATKAVWDLLLAEEACSALMQRQQFQWQPSKHRPDLQSLSAIEQSLLTQKQVCTWSPYYHKTLPYVLLLQAATKDDIVQGYPQLQSF